MWPVISKYCSLFYLEAVPTFDFVYQPVVTGHLITRFRLNLPLSPCMDLLAVTIVVMAAFSEQLGGVVGSPPFAFVWPPTVAATLAVSVQTSHFFPLQC